MSRKLFCVCLALFSMMALALAKWTSPSSESLALAQAPETDANLRVGTYNLRMQWLDKNGPNAWEHRHDKCVRSIRDNDFDVFGVQEVTDFAAAELSSDLRDTYAAIFFSPYRQDGSGNQRSGIFYKKKRFKLVDYHFFWISDTPFEMSENDHCGDKVYKRGGACAIFKDKQTGKKFCFINHHGILNPEENLRYAHVLVDMEEKFNPKGYPSFLVGDFNVRAEHPSHQVWRTHWHDSAETAGERQCTMNSFCPYPAKWDKARHIDFIYYRNIAAPTGFMVNQTLYDGRCASDHFPVWADFSL